MATDKSGKLVKFILEYENEVHTLEGEVAREHIKEVNSYIAIHSLRTGGTGVKEKNWKIDKK